MKQNTDKTPLDIQNWFESEIDKQIEIIPAPIIELSKKRKDFTIVIDAVARNLCFNRNQVKKYITKKFAA